MSRELATIPQDVPAYLVNAAQARAINDNALAGVGTGFPPSIRIQGSKFRIVDGNGEETVIKAADLKGSEFLDVVVLAAKRELDKSWYATKYDPNQTETNLPDCFSSDAVTPDPTAASPQSVTCAGCPRNAYGSGTNAQGNPTKGKDCSDKKVLAVFRGGAVYQFKIPPASLKNWGLYVKTLSNRGIPVGNVVTYIGFSDDTQFPVLEFRHGAWVPESLLQKLADKAASQETLDITNPTGYNAPAAIQQPQAKAPETVAAQAVQDPSPEAEHNKASEDLPRRRGPKPKSEATVDVATDDEIAQALGL